jgi:AcrR family transcriptional regulator
VALPNPQRRSQKERSAESARRLMDAAIELGSEKGFDRTSVAEICVRAGYSRAMVHERYGSKEGLLRALLESEFETWVTPPVLPGQTGLVLALEHITAVQRAAAEQPRTLRAYLVLCFETTGAIPELAEWFKAAVIRYRESVASALRQGQSDGSVRKELDPEAAARHLLAYIFGGGLQWSLDPELFDLQTEFPAWRKELVAAWGTTTNKRPKH